MKSELVGIGGVLYNNKGDVLYIFSKHMGVCVSNEAEVLSILDALRCFSRLLHGDLIVEIDHSNTSAWVSN